MAGDPAIERLRDALGLLRVLWTVERHGSVRRAGASLASALAAAESRRREKELPARLAIARRDVEAAARELPAHAAVLRAVMEHLKPLGGRGAVVGEGAPSSLPPWWERDGAPGGSKPSD